MAWAKVSITDEFWQPLVSVTVEAFELDNPHKVLQTEVTDTGGVVDFTGLPSDKRFFFKARVDRHSGNFGDKQMYGMVRLQILASSGANCYDAVVDPSGEFGTHETIQAAITSLFQPITPGFVEHSYTILIMGGTYTEQITIPSESPDNWHFIGCGARQEEGSSHFTSGAGSTNVIINGQAGRSVLWAPSLVEAGTTIWEGIHFLSSLGTGVGLSTWYGGKGRHYFNECIFENATGEGCKVVIGAWLEMRNCVSKSNQTTLTFDSAPGYSFFHNCHFWGEVRIFGGEGTIFSDCSVVANVATGALIINSGSIVTDHYRVTGCTIQQKSADGAAIGIAVGGSSVADGGRGAWIIVGNEIHGNTGGLGVDFGASAYGVVTGNSFYRWNTGITIRAGAVCGIAGNVFKLVTTPVSGTAQNEEQVALGNAPADAVYAVTAADAQLPNARTITAGTGLTIVDGGAGGALTFNVTTQSPNHEEYIPFGHNPAGQTLTPTATQYTLYDAAIVIRVT